MKFVVSLFLVVFSVSAFSAQTKFNRLIVFGDSLSDVGTYAPVAVLKGGGKFTTNPGKLWVEHIAANMGLPLKPNRNEGFGIPFRKIGGFNYAQGGARIAGAAETQSKYTARPVTTQVGYFLMDHKQFLASDLVFVQGGGNDIFSQLRQIQNKSITVQQGIANMAQAAEDLSVVIGNLISSGAQNVVVLNLPAIDTIPKFINLDANAKAVVKQMVTTFNATLAIKTAGYRMFLIDAHSMDIYFNENYKSLGFESIQLMACNPKGLVGGTSLFCGPKQLVAPGADQVRKFADDIHPAAGYSKWVADQVWPLVADEFGMQ